MDDMKYRGNPVGDIVRSSVSASGSDPLVFLMGPYRLLDPTYLYPATDYSLPADPLAPDNAGPHPTRIESTLREITTRVTEETSATAFIASDVDIPTRKEVKDKEVDEPGMPVIDQSVACARASAGCAFTFTKAGLTTGVGAETGAIPEHFRLREPDVARKGPRTFCIFAEGVLNDDGTYDLRFRYFATRTEFVEKLITFVESYVVPLHDDQ